MTSDRKKPGVAFWATVVVVVVLLAYPLSFGPACWGATRLGPSFWDRVESVYRPILRAWYVLPPPAADAIGWYANLGAAYRFRSAKTIHGEFVITVVID